MQKNDRSLSPIKNGQQNFYNDAPLTPEEVQS